MVRYVEFPTIIEVLGFKVSMQWTLVYIGVAVAFFEIMSRAHVLKVPKRYVFEILIFSVIPGIYGGKVLGVIWYFPSEVATEAGLYETLTGSYHPVSSTAGFFSALVCLSLYLLIRKIEVSKLLLLDFLCVGGMIGQTIGRISCALDHDHLSEITTFFMAIEYPSGPRHNLGLYEFLFLLFIMLPTLFVVRRKAPPPGAEAATCFILYGSIRFLLEFMRADDTRYFSLTPAQYFSLACIAIGVGLVIYLYHQTKTRNQSCLKVPTK